MMLSLSYFLMSSDVLSIRLLTSWAMLQDLLLKDQALVSRTVYLDDIGFSKKE